MTELLNGSGRAAVATAAGIALALVASPAHGHAYVGATELNAGWKQDIEIRIPHGCKGSPTTQVRVKIPDGMVAVMPEHNRDWKITTKMRKLPQPVRGEGGVVLTETVDEITWSGSSLPDHLFERFVFRATVPNEPGRMLWFKTIQTCKVGEHRWVEVPPAGTKMGDFFKATPEPAAFAMIVKPARAQYPF